MISVARRFSVILVLSTFCLGSQTNGGSSTSTSTGGSAHTVTQTLLSAPYIKGDFFLAPWGTDSGNCNDATTPCLTIGYLQTVSGITGGKVVLLHGGLYYNSAVNLTASGSAGSPIVYSNYPDETPILTGAQRLAGWIPATSTGLCANIPSCWQTTIPTTIPASYKNFEYLIYAPAGWPQSHLPYVMERRSQSMNTPTGYNLTTGVVSSACMTPGVNNINPCYDRVFIKAGDVKPLSYHLRDVRFLNLLNWNVDVLRLASYSPTQLVFTGSTIANSNHGFATNERYLIVNSLEYFQQNQTPGTFYLDCGTSTPSPGPGACADPARAKIDGATLFYIAKPGEQPSADLILAPQQAQIITDVATVQGSSSASNLAFQGLVFIGDNFVTPGAGYQSNTGQPNAPAALSFVDSQNVSLNSIIVAHTSGWGLEFTNDSYTGTGCPGPCTGLSSNNSLANSAVYDIGTSGLRLGRYPPNLSSGAPNLTDLGNSDVTATQATLVQNNIFSGMGRMYPGGEAGCVWIGSSHNNAVQDNDCVDSYPGGMAVGPGVAFTNTYVHDNSILRNNLHDLGEGVMSDLGCVHFANLGGSSYGGGDSFQNNICHDITHALLGLGSAIGLYIDNNSQRVTASSNLVYRTSGALFLDNASPSCSVTCNNTLSNNILAYSMQGPTRRGGNDPGLTFTFQNNVVYYDNNGPQAVNDDGTGFWNCNGNCPLRFSFISNDYFSPTIGAPHFITTAPDNTWDFAGWQGSPPNEDSGSKNLDPLFGNPAFSSGFTVDPTVAGMIGFITSDFSKTYTAGRSQHSISPPSTGATFPLQLLAPSQF